MRRVYTLAAIAAAVLSIGAGSAAAASTEHHGAPSVTALSIVPAAGRADVVIAIEGAVEVVDFTLDNPRRVVVDLRGATLGMPARLYDKISRAGHHERPRRAVQARRGAAGARPRRPPRIHGGARRTRRAHLGERGGQFRRVARR